jgi:2'-5' RNA ligase
VADDPVARTNEPAMRLFLAVEVPEAVRRDVAAAIEPWRAAFPKVRWAPSANWHVTLKFLGATAADRVRWIEETVRDVAATHRPATIEVRGLGAFPSAERARTLWAGVDDPGANLDDVVSALEAGLAESFRKEMRRFHPHLTVARSEPPVRLPAEYAKTPLISGPFTVDRVVLFRSVMRSGSTTYEPLGSFPFGE